MASAPSPTASRSRRRVNWNNLAFSLGLPLLALVFALAVCAVILLLPDRLTILHASQPTPSSEVLSISSAGNP